MDERPPADPAKLLIQFDDWRRGDELPGRTLSNLKTGRLDELLTELGAEGQPFLELLEPWERGRADPAEVLTGLSDAGLATVLQEASAAS